MIVIIVSKLSNGDTSRTFGGVACDVEGCDVLEPQPAGQQKNLVNEGWFIAPGQHRCPEHFHTATPVRGPDHRHVDAITKRI